MASSDPRRGGCHCQTTWRPGPGATEMKAQKPDSTGILWSFWSRNLFFGTPSALRSRTADASAGRSLPLGKLIRWRLGCHTTHLPPRHVRWKVRAPVVRRYCANHRFTSVFGRILCLPQACGDILIWAQEINNMRMQYFLHVVMAEIIFMSAAKSKVTLLETPKTTAKRYVEMQCTDLRSLSLCVPHDLAHLGCWAHKKCAKH